jgi:REP element-mobilizing transposase RayT
MSQSLAAVYVHLVFSTKHRAPVIGDWSCRLYDYIGGIMAHHDGVLLTAGGMPDHVHLLVSVDRKWSLADLLRDIKAGSSKWVHDNFPDARTFGWQDGYGAFSVSVSKLDEVMHYIRNQVRHHRKLSFRDELRELLRKHGLEWDERFVWN